CHNHCYIILQCFYENYFNGYFLILKKLSEIIMKAF
uniref:Uncharacterized protein n=1 Tax=Ciona intestinalis TaxID=7719 RepID=H2XWN5_CIOIN